METDDEFQRLVQEYLVLPGGDRARDLAYALEVMPTTIQRWASGSARPMRSVREYAIAWILRHK